MDWTRAIDRNRAALLAVVAAIIALIGGREGDGPVARRVRSAALALLRPAESALRRLIIVAARGLAPAPRPTQVPAFARAALPVTGGSRTPAFPLFDRPKRFGRLLVVTPPRGVPRIRSFWVAAAPWPSAAQEVPAAPQSAARPDPAALVDIGRLRLRLRSLEAALADLPRQARRLAGWRARRAAAMKPCLPLRIGHPPGRVARSERDIDLVLRDCHALAREALAREVLAREAWALEALALDTS